MSGLSLTGTGLAALKPLSGGLYGNGVTITDGLSLTPQGGFSLPAMGLVLRGQGISELGLNQGVVIAVLTPGTTSWQVPANVTTLAFVAALGPGGGGAAGVVNTRGGGGGGGGAYAERASIAVTPGSTLTVQVGAGGTSDATFLQDSGSVTQVSAAAGTTATTNAGGTGGLIASSVGSTRRAGGNGSNAATGTGNRGGAGGGGSANDVSVGGSNANGRAGAGGAVAGGGGAGSVGGGITGAGTSSAGVGGVGGTNPSNTGGGAGGTPTVAAGAGSGGGGGGGGSSGTGVNGAAGGNSIWSYTSGGFNQTFAGGGGAGGGGGLGGNGGTGALGAGGGGAGSTAAAAGTGGAGGNGVLLIAYGTPGMSLPLATAITPSAISLGWPSFGINTTQYQVWRAGLLVGTSTTAGTGLIESSLSESTSYTYDVYALDAQGIRTWGGAVTATTIAATPVRFQTSFEEDTSSPTAFIGGWSKDAAVPAEIYPTTEQARNAGGKSIKFNFLYSNWIDTIPGHRAQIFQPTAYRTAAILGVVQWMGVSTYIDDSWEPDFDDNREIIWQFHGQTGGPGRLSPPLSLQGQGDQVRILLLADAVTSYDCDIDSPSGVELATFDLAALKGKWVDWVVKVNFDYTGGSLDVWKDGEHVVAYTGSTIYRCTVQPNEDGPFVGLGVYKWNWGVLPTKVSTRLVYIDDVKFGDNTATCTDVKPTGALPCQP